MQETHISLAHGNGGRFMRELITELFARHLENPGLDVELDAASIGKLDGEIMITTDGFTVQPLEFPGGNIGSLAVHGTVNDLAVSGAMPQYLTLNAFIEEGLEIDLLERLVASLAQAAAEAGVRVVAGDTKILRRGEGGGVYFATTGVGLRHTGSSLAMEHIKQGDQVIVSGPVGDHGTAIMLAREQFGMRGDLHSDSASVLPFTRAALEIDGVRFMRDPTRGGLATVMHEIHLATGHGVLLFEEQIPVNDPVRSVCEMLGYDPYYLACEGRVVAIVSDAASDALLHAWQQLPGGEQAAVIGRIIDGDIPVVLQTMLGGQRILDELEDDPLPRIC